VAKAGWTRRDVTIYDVARHAGVGAMSVSRVINGGHRVSPQMMMRVRASIIALNYTPNLAARSTRSGQAPIRVGSSCRSPWSSGTRPPCGDALGSRGAASRDCGSQASFLMII